MQDVIVFSAARDSGFGSVITVFTELIVMSCVLLGILIVVKWEMQKDKRMVLRIFFAIFVLSLTGVIFRFVYKVASCSSDYREVASCIETRCYKELSGVVKWVGAYAGEIALYTDKGRFLIDLSQRCCVAKQEVHELIPGDIVYLQYLGEIDQPDYDSGIIFISRKLRNIPYTVDDQE